MSKSVPPYPASGKQLLAGKTVLVTAAAGTGIGFATARRCAEEGARVMISDFHERRLLESAAEIEKLTAGGGCAGDGYHSRGGAEDGRVLRDGQSGIAP